MTISAFSVSKQRSEPVKSGALAFQEGKKATKKDVQSFVDAVNKNAEKVCIGIIQELKKEGIKDVDLIQKGNKYQLIVPVQKLDKDEVLTIVYADSDSAGPEAEDEKKTNITITASTADAANVIDALNRFFANWRAVVGLIATGAAYAGYTWLMSVNKS